ncbi:hypothetical protein [Streptococcus porci]|uniref:hypothetical protein n=1 Tax=Streptococcus porci TaxID=502567 RepID=UPI0004140E0D|nr:hypothetical protein [Streptococcus porci]
MKTTDQSIFDEIIKQGNKLGFTMHESLPMEDVPYPFVNMLDIQYIPQPNKSQRKGKYAVALTVWGESHQRRLVAEMTAKLWQSCLKLSIGDFKTVLLSQSSSYRIYEERQSEVSTLWRSDMSLEFLIL